MTTPAPFANTCGGSSSRRRRIRRDGLGCRKSGTSSPPDGMAPLVRPEVTVERPGARARSRSLRARPNASRARTVVHKVPPGSRDYSADAYIALGPWMMTAHCSLPALRSRRQGTAARQPTSSIPTWRSPRPRMKGQCACTGHRLLARQRMATCELLNRSITRSNQMYANFMAAYVEDLRGVSAQTRHDGSRTGRRPRVSQDCPVPVGIVRVPFHAHQGVCTNSPRGPGSGIRVSRGISTCFMNQAQPGWGSSGIAGLSNGAPPRSLYGTVPRHPRTQGAGHGSPSSFNAPAMSNRHHVPGWAHFRTGRCWRHGPLLAGSRRLHTLVVLPRTSLHAEALEREE